MPDSVRPHIRQPTRLPSPWESPGKNTGVGCHFLLQCMKVKSESEVTQSCPTLRDPMDCSLPGSSIHGIFQEEYWSGVPLPSPNNTLQGINSRIFEAEEWTSNWEDRMVEITATEQNICCSVCAQKAPARPGLPWSCPAA